MMGIVPLLFSWVIMMALATAPLSVVHHTATAVADSAVLGALLPNPMLDAL
jgi:hypothetical protein